MGGGGKGGGGGDSTAQTALNFQIVQWLTDQETQKQTQAKQDEYNRQMIQLQKDRDASDAARWDKSFALQQQQLNQSAATSQSTTTASTTGNVSKDNAAKSSAGEAQAGRVKTLYSLPSARTRGNRVVLGSTGDTNNSTVFKRVLGE